MTAPLVEALLVLDRYLFLRERGHAAAVIPIFDPLLSPRAFALVGLKYPRTAGSVRVAPDASEI
eukprot:4630277-Prorocentrum_lima.AAC.1